MKISKHRFFCDRIDDLELPKTEAHHAVKVLRLSTGQGIHIIDGKGRQVLAEITDISKQALHYTIIEDTVLPEPPLDLHIAIAPTKSNERIEFFLEKAVEIGISRITPIFTSNSERKTIKPERWEKIIVSAAKQSGNLHFPKLESATKLNHFFESLNDSEIDCFIAHCETSDTKSELKNALGNSKKVCILIGPEGDFTPEEITLALENGFKPVSLGPSRLRTETAGIIACHTANLVLS